MPAINIHLVGDDCWPDLDSKSVEMTQEPIGVALLKGGMVSGKPSVTIRIDLPGDRVVLAETSLDLFVAAARAMTARMEAFP
jgi:hypothetical protein